MTEGTRDNANLANTRFLASKALIITSVVMPAMGFTEAMIDWHKSSRAFPISFRVSFSIAGDPFSIS